MVINTAPQVNSVAITVSVSSAESPGLILFVEGERRILPPDKRRVLYREFCDLIVDASELWGDK
jgi:hypothetical protein